MSCLAAPKPAKPLPRIIVNGFFLGRGFANKLLGVNAVPTAAIPVDCKKNRRFIKNNLSVYNNKRAKRCLALLFYDKIFRAITSFWTSEVPSPIVINLESRKYFSAGYSFVYP